MFKIQEALTHDHSPTGLPAKRHWLALLILILCWQGPLVGSSSAASEANITADNGTAPYYEVTALDPSREDLALTAGSVAPSGAWTNVKMGGGGYIPGIIYHPTAAKLRYARTDMDGVYRWDNSISKWTALTDGFAPEDGGNEGAESLAVDPTDANKVYMTTSMSVSWGNGRFYYSSDQGNNWNYVTLPFPIGSNDSGRAIGERLMVDPNLPSTMFYASRTAGLWKSINSGLNWSQVTSLSSRVLTAGEISGSAIGVEFVVFDATVPTTGFTPKGGATQTIYVGVAPDYQSLAGLSSYLYKSTNGGATWTGIAIPGAVTSEITSNLHIPHLARAADGMLYVPFTSGAGPGSGAPSFLYQFDGGTTWTQLTRTTNGVAGVGSYYGGIGGLSVHGSGATTKIVFGVSGTWGDGGWVQIAMASADAGATWHEIGRSGDTNGSLNYHDVSGYWGWVDTLQIDPFNPDHVSYGIGGGIMSTTDAFSASAWLPHWTFDVNGIEEMVNLGMTAPPPTASYVLLSAHGDTGLYVNTSLTSSANNRSPGLGGGNGTGIDMAWNNPAYIAAVGTYGSTSNGAYSTNSGVTWTNFATVPPTASNTGDHSKVAVTADGSNVIWSVAGQIPYYTTNNGAAWTATNLPAPMAAYNASYHIAADRKNPLKVYAYDHGGDWWNPSGSGKFYYSIDGGHTFTASTQTWDPYGFNNTDLAVNPFVEGDLWLADANNLWHSVNSGLTWTKLTGTLVGTGNTTEHGAMKVALGVPATGSSYSAAVYFVGRLLIGGVYVYGVYRSDDAGAHWTRIDDDNHRYGGVGGIVADTRVYGRVFLAGRGMNYNAGVCTVNGSSSLTIQSAVDAAMPGALISVSGTCSENVVVRNEAMRITIDGGNATELDGPSVASATLTIRGKGILVQNMSVTGGRNGIEVQRGSSASLNNNLVGASAGDGIVVHELAFAAITNSTIQNNGHNGITVLQGGVANIGFNFADDAVASPNLVQHNTGRGILVNERSMAWIVGNTVANNGDDGISVQRESHATLAGNTVNGNGTSYTSGSSCCNGVNISDKGSVYLGADASLAAFFQAANRTTVNNLNYGVRCVRGGLVAGHLGNSNPVTGAVSQFGNGASGTLGASCQSAVLTP